MEPIRRTTVFQRERTVNNLAAVKAQITQAQVEATTGTSVNSAQDAPELWVTVSRLRSETTDQQRYAKNSQYAQAILDAGENALSQSGNLLKRAHELAIQAANPTLNAAARKNVAAEVDQIRTNLINLANTQVSGRYVFAGTNYDQAAFSATGTYQGNGTLPDTQVARNQHVSTGYDGAAVFTGTVNTFQILSDLSTALQTNNSTAIAAAVGDVSDAIDQNVTWLQEAGNRSRSVIDAGDLAEQMTLVAQKAAENLTGVDQASAFQRLISLRQTYESALSVAAATGRDNLFARLG